MGYTHYWTPKKVTQEQWDKYLKICEKLKENSPVLIGGNNNGEKAVFNQKMIWFNGQPEQLGHETFHIDKDVLDWNFCKTARKPYDLLVGACLIAAKKYLGYEVSSDGDNEDWQPIFDFYNKASGELVNNFIE